MDVDWVVVHDHEDVVDLHWGAMNKKTYEIAKWFYTEKNAQAECDRRNGKVKKPRYFLSAEFLGEGATLPVSYAVYDTDNNERPICTFLDHQKQRAEGYCNWLNERDDDE